MSMELLGRKEEKPERMAELLNCELAKRLEHETASKDENDWLHDGFMALIS